MEFVFDLLVEGLPALDAGRVEVDQAVTSGLLHQTHQNRDGVLDGGLAAAVLLDPLHYRAIHDPVGDRGHREVSESRQDPFAPSAQVGVGRFWFQTFEGQRHVVLAVVQN
ncbi:hypothetical protein ACFYV7_30830 [Nocardia suismassiliense]|uniref:Uncharacterized protein n=1 Tax=Nocardia suismassiliense TaxID=2077092 RepID=A0ABW6R2A8_9NOCA